MLYLYHSYYYDQGYGNHQGNCAHACPHPGGLPLEVWRAGTRTGVVGRSKKGTVFLIILVVCVDLRVHSHGHRVLVHASPRLAAVVSRLRPNPDRLRAMVLLTGA